MIVYGGKGSDGVLDLSDGTGPVDITREMHYEAIKGGPRVITNGHTVYTLHIIPAKPITCPWADFSL